MSGFNSDDDFGPPKWLLLCIGLAIAVFFAVFFTILCRVFCLSGRWAQHRQHQLPTYTSQAISVPPPVNSSAYVQHYMQDQAGGQATSATGQFSQSNATTMAPPPYSSETNYARY
ncbi:hypothetical protein HDE_14104 [Halotydeus destructor]|nr:hypothetical protein HDE_14104 [Halotydeus destructor]